MCVRTLDRGGLDKDFAAMRSFFGSSFGDSDFSFGSDLDSSEYEEDTEPFTARRPVQKRSGNHTSATVASFCEPKPTPSPPSPTNQDQYDASNGAYGGLMASWRHSALPPPNRSMAGMHPPTSLHAKRTSASQGT